MPSLQRSLSVEDLYQKFNKKISRQDPPTISTPSPPAISVPSPPLSRIHHPRQPLSPRLPDPLIFKGDRSKFEDWKLKILDMLSLNGDYYPNEPFKIAYVLTRLGGRVVEYTLSRRRSLKSQYLRPSKPYLCVVDLLQHMDDIDQINPWDIRSNNCQDLEELRYNRKSFPEFYDEFRRYADDLELPDKDLIHSLSVKSQKPLYKAWLYQGCSQVLSKVKKTSVIPTL